jgi:hypothetical protein
LGQVGGDKRTSLQQFIHRCRRKKSFVDLAKAFQKMLKVREFWFRVLSERTTEKRENFVIFLKQGRLVAHFV